MEGYNSVMDTNTTTTSTSSTTTSTSSTTTSTSSTTTSTSSTTTTLYTRGEIDVKFFNDTVEGLIAGEMIQINLESNGRNGLLRGVLGGNYKNVINVSVTESGIVSGSVNEEILEIELFSDFGNIQGRAGFIPIGLKYNSDFGSLVNVGGQRVNLNFNENGVTGIGSIYSLIVAIAIHYFF